jgi:hypothetical protein
MNRSAETLWSVAIASRGIGGTEGSGNVWSTISILGLGGTDDAVVGCSVLSAMAKVETGAVAGVRGGVWISVRGA